MRPATADDPVDGPVFGPDTVIRNAVHAVVGSEKPIRVMEGGALLGLVDRAHVLEAIAGDEVVATGATDGRSGPPADTSRIDPVDDVFQGTATLLAEAGVKRPPSAR
jgi:hypothetical protein